jgi:hypothetical protein
MNSTIVALITHCIVATKREEKANPVVIANNHCEKPKIVEDGDEEKAILFTLLDTRAAVFSYAASKAVGSVHPVQRPS